MDKLNYTPRAVERIEHFCDFDAPVANAISTILDGIRSGASAGKPFSALDESVHEESRIKQSLKKDPPEDNYKIHWRVLKGKSLHTHVLVVVLFEDQSRTVVTAGYIPRQLPKMH